MGSFLARCWLLFRRSEKRRWLQDDWNLLCLQHHRGTRNMPDLRKPWSGLETTEAREIDEALSLASRVLNLKPMLCLRETIEREASVRIETSQALILTLIVNQSNSSVRAQVTQNDAPINPRRKRIASPPSP